MIRHFFSVSLLLKCAPTSLAKNSEKRISTNDFNNLSSFLSHLVILFYSRMAAPRATNKNLCARCAKPKNTVKCAGCDKDFCLDDMIIHRQELSEQLGHTEDQFNQFAHDIEQESRNTHIRPLMEQIDQWEQQSINKIQQAAEEIRHQLSSRVSSYDAELKLQLKRLSDKLVECRHENDYVDTDIHYYDEQLKLLKVAYDTPLNLQLGYTSTSFIERIHLESDGKLLF
jgi:hypothetical protein